MSSIACFSVGRLAMNARDSAGITYLSRHMLMGTWLRTAAADSLRLSATSEAIVGGTAVGMSCGFDFDAQRWKAVLVPLVLPMRALVALLGSRQLESSDPD